MVYITDDTATETVIVYAAEAIGKNGTSAQIKQVTEYLTTKQWFATAGDLRQASQSQQHWNALEIPTRLKMAICDVLNAEEDTYYDQYPYEEQESTEHYEVVQYDPPPAPAEAAPHYDNTTVNTLPSTSSEEWNCPTCTLLNTASACQACETARPELCNDKLLSSSIQNATPVSSIVASNDEEIPTATVLYGDSESIPPTSTWDCKSCGYFTNPMTASNCVACQSHVSFSYPDDDRHSLIPTAPSSTEIRGAEYSTTSSFDPYPFSSEEEHLQFSQKKDSKVKYPSLRNDMFYHNPSFIQTSVDLPQVQDNLAAFAAVEWTESSSRGSTDQEEVKMRKRTIRMPWQSKFKVDDGKKSRTKRALEKLHLKKRSLEDDDFSIDSSSSEDSSSSSSESSEED